MADVAERRERLAASGTQVAFVHMGPEEEAAALLGRYGLEDVPRVSDPEGGLYRAVGLGRARWWQVLGPRVWVRGVVSFFRGQRPGRMIGDPMQMPGVAVVEKGRVVRVFRHRTSADRPDYERLACPIPSGGEERSK